MSKLISQSTFDEVVKENIDEFDMSLEDAINDAINQFKSQGVDLISIDTTGGIGREECLKYINDIINMSNNNNNNNILNDEDIIKLNNSLKRNKIVHELFHAKDYKKPTAEYIKATSGSTVGSKRDYYTAKNEFPVQIAAIMHEINLQQKELLRRSKAGTGMSFWKNRRNLLLQSIANLINATKMTEVHVPQFLSDYKGFIDTLYRNKNNPSYKKYYNEYKQKLKQLYSNIQRTRFTNSNEEGA